MTEMREETLQSVPVMEVVPGLTVIPQERLVGVKDSLSMQSMVEKDYLSRSSAP